MNFSINTENAENQTQPKEAAFAPATREKNK
jgi:hypothetical protein